MPPVFNTDPEVLRTEVEVVTFRGSGPGGQHRNKVESGVRMVHPPSGISVTATEHRSQHQNRALALRRLREKLLERNRKKKPRVPTRPSRASASRRLEAKRRRAQKKNLRVRGRFTQ